MIMAFKSVVKCAVSECNGQCSDEANLCEKHLVPGMVVKHGDNTCVVTAWFAEHANLAGVILLNDFALGDLFGGARGFKAKLEQQGFEKIQNLRTPEEFTDAKIRVAKSPGGFSGPWLTEYSWESGAE
jgi:hypothetical protein